MRFDTTLKTLNDSSKEKFGGEYGADVTDNLFCINYGIAKAIQKIEKLRQITEIKNNDIYLAEGNAQDILYSQDFIIRKAESKAKGVWTTTLSTPGTVIEPYQLKLKTNTDVTFTNIEKVTINSSGTSNILVECEQFGKVGNVEANEICTIKTPLNGISPGCNLSKFEGGADVENDYEYRKRYLKLRGSYTGLTKDDIQKELLNKAGVIAVQLEENHDEESKTLDNGLILTRKSFVAYVYGGADIDVATALALKLNTSIKQFGDVEISIFSKIRKVYEIIKFYRPKNKTINYSYEIIGEVNVAEVERVIEKYLLNTEIGVTVTSYLAEREIRASTDDRNLISIEVKFSDTPLNFKNIFKLKTGEKITEVSKNG